MFNTHYCIFRVVASSDPVPEHLQEFFHPDIIVWLRKTKSAEGPPVQPCFWEATHNKQGHVQGFSNCWSKITSYRCFVVCSIFFPSFFGCIFSLAHWVALMVCPASLKLDARSRIGVLTTCEPEKWKQFLVGVNIHASRKKNKTKTKADKSRLSLWKCVYIIVTLTKHSSERRHPREKELR